MLVFPASPLAAGAAGGAGKTLTLTELRTQRKEMAQRRRRIIFNNDGDDIGGYGAVGASVTKTHEDMAATPEGLLALRTTALLGSQVDSIFYHSTRGLKLFYEDGPFKTIYEYPDRTGISARNCRILLDDYGKDALDVMVDCCRKNSIEIFYSHRMNDAHDYYMPEVLAAIKVRHPEYTIGHAQSGGRSPAETLKLMREGQKSYTGLNFALPVIRELTVDAMRAVCRDYDIDGLELDYFRAPLSVPSHPASANHIALMNDLMRDLRAMTEEEGLRRGRPILIAARYMGDLEQSLRYGLDVKTWLEEDLVDILMTKSMYANLQPMKALFDLGHSYNVPSYPMVNCAYKDGYGQRRRFDWEIWRGDAMLRFSEGADGITTFNSFDPTLPLWWELGDPEILAGLSKTYLWDYPSSGYGKIEPVPVTTEGCEPILLLVGEDLTVPAPAGTTRSLKLHIRVSGLTAGHGLMVKVNGNALEGVTYSTVPDDTPKNILLMSVPSPPLFKVGKNPVEATLARANGPVQIEQVALHVLYPKESMRDSANWEAGYEADMLPSDDGWVQRNNPVGTVADGVLILGDKSDGRDGYRKENVLSAKHGMSIEYRIRVTAGPETGTVFDSRHPNAPSPGLGLGEAIFKLADFGPKAYARAGRYGKPFVTRAIDISEWHTYRCTYAVDAGMTTLYVDDNPTPVGSAQGTGCGFTPPNFIEFNPSRDDSVIELDWVRWTTTGEYAPSEGTPNDERGAAMSKLTLTELRARRREMTQRRRRIIFNNDGDDIGGYGGSGPTSEQREMAATPEGLLKIRTTALLGSQVDSIFYHSTYGMKLFYSDGPFKEIYEYPARAVSQANCKRLMARNGKDALDAMVDFCRRHGLEIFYSNRMNDTHDYYFPEILAAIKVRHPEYTIGHAQGGGRSPAETLRLMREGKKSNTGLNFALDEVRELTVAAMREVSRNYDIDGIELDYFRSPVLFPAPVGPAQIERLNDMMRDMRKMTEEEGLKRGRPILIAARPARTIAASLTYGLDVRTWLEEDLVDIIMQGRFINAQGPRGELIELAHRYDVPVYPMVAVGSGMSEASLVTTERVERFRGDAMTAFREGADGVTTFNMYIPTVPQWREIGDPDVLAPLDKAYYWNYVPSTGGGVRPVTVTADPCEPMPVFIGDDPAVSPAGTARSFTLRVHHSWVEKDPAAVTGLTPKDKLAITLNGKELHDGELLPDLVGDQRTTASLAPFSQEWRFKTDPADEGVNGKWFAPELDDGDWAVVRSDRGTGWESQGFKGYLGYGWCRAELPPLPAHHRTHVYVHFGAVDEQAWVYLNGKPIAEHTMAKTGLPLDEIWLEPFGVDVSKRLRADGPNVLAVRVHNAMFQGGIWKPVYLVLSDVPIDGHRQQDAVLQLTPGPRSGWTKFTLNAEHLTDYENLIQAAAETPPTQNIRIDGVMIEVRAAGTEAE